MSRGWWTRCSAVPAALEIFLPALYAGLPSWPPLRGWCWLTARPTRANCFSGRQPTSAPTQGKSAGVGHLQEGRGSAREIPLKILGMAALCTSLRILTLRNWRGDFYPPLAVAPAGMARGRVKKKVEPWPSALSTRMRPPWASTMCLAMARPRPVPPDSRERALSTR